jgi:hypothetical protein
VNKAKNTPLISSAATVAVFTAANGLICAPYSGTSILPFVAAAAFAFFAVAVTQFLLIKISKERAEIPKRAVFLALSIASAFAAVFSLREYSRFIFDDVLTRGNYLTVKAIFTVCVFALAAAREHAIYKFSLLSAVLVSGVFAVLFFTSLKTFDAGNLKSAISLTGFSFKQTAVYYFKMFLPALPAAAFVCGNEKAIKAGALGTAWAVLLCAVVLLDCILSFSLPLAAKLDYPYIDDISTVTVGSLFTRMDGFAYIAFFVCYLVKCGVCVRLCGRLVQRAGIKNRKAALAAVCVLIFAFA